MPTKAISNLFWYKTSEQKQSSSTENKFRKGNIINSHFSPLPQRAKLVQHWHMRYIHHYLKLLDHLKHFCVNKPRVITPGPSVFLFSPPVIPAGRHSQHLHSDCSPLAAQQEAAAPARTECRKPVAWFKTFKLLPKCEY